jgi:hypothetical protein
MDSRLSIEKNNIKLTPFPDTNQIVILWYLYPALPVIETVFSETNQLNSLEGTTLKSVNHASKFTVSMFTITK